MLHFPFLLFLVILLSAEDHVHGISKNKKVVVGEKDDERYFVFAPTLSKTKKLKVEGRSIYEVLKLVKLIRLHSCSYMQLHLLPLFSRQPFHI